MTILAVDTSAKPASVAILKDDKLISEIYIDTGFTHSETIMPMVLSALDIAKLSLEHIDYLAVNVGPGSFTGIRIGVSMIKGLAMGKNIPCIGVSTLDAMTKNISPTNGIICAVMDARRQQVYNAVYQITDGIVAKVKCDRAIPACDLVNELAETSNGKPIYVIGDGEKVVFDAIDKLEIGGKANFVKISSNLKYQRASGVALVAANKVLKGEVVTGKELLPTYLRLSQAERERLGNKDAIKA